MLKRYALLMMGITVFVFGMQQDHVKDQVDIDYNKIAQQRLEEQARRSSRRYFHRDSSSDSDSNDDRPFHRGEKKVRKRSKL